MGTLCVPMEAGYLRYRRHRRVRICCVSGKFFLSIRRDRSHQSIDCRFDLHRKGQSPSKGLFVDEYVLQLINSRR